MKKLTKKEYEKLLKTCPKDHNSPEFIDWLRENNKVVHDGPYWLIIRNVKYWTPENRWITAFWKGGSNIPTGPCLWSVFYKYYNWEILKKDSKRQTIKRWHIHLYRNK